MGRKGGMERGGRGESILNCEIKKKQYLFQYKTGSL